MTSSKEFTFNFLNISENFWFLVFCTHNWKSWIAK